MRTFGLIPNPLAVIPNVFSETLRALPTTWLDLSLLLCLGVDGRLSGEPDGNLDERLRDQGRDWVEVGGNRRETQPLPLERD